jgi:hypothetical protein
MGDVVPFRQPDKFDLRSRAGWARRNARLERSAASRLDCHPMRQRAYEIIQHLSTRHNIWVMVDHLPACNAELLDRVMRLNEAVSCLRDRIDPAGGTFGVYIDFVGSKLSWTLRLDRYSILQLPADASPDEIAVFLRKPLRSSSATSR